MHYNEGRYPVHVDESPVLRSLPATRNDLEAILALAMRHDRSRLRSVAMRLSKQVLDTPAEPAVAAWYERLDRSIGVAQSRKSSLPVIQFPESLPISEHVAAIQRHLETRSTLVVCGETGSGKSTQLPKILLNAGFGITGTIAHTQPRRIAARSVATRLAEELQTTVGKGVGFKIRFTDRTAPETWVKLMTDGVLLAETQSDRDLDRYDAIIVDEAHERSLNIDFLLGYLHRLRERRPELRVVVTSATLDAERFAEHFRDQHGPAPIHSVAGRTYPVEIRYRPLVATDEVEQDDPDELDPLDGLVEATRELLRDSTGDILAFFATESEIRAALKRLQGVFQDRVREGSLELLPLYARLGVEEQQRIFRPAKGRRIVLATNVAESSLTVPGVRSVIDLGTARIARYAPRSKVQRLPIEPVSRASADQRAGRCGRLGPGICIRLYAEQDYAGRDRFTTPEIRRTDLASVILRTETLRLGRVDAFPFLDPPLPEAIRDGYRTLFELGAVDENRRITELGKRLGKLPVHPRVARMLLAAHEEGCLHDMTIVAAGLEIQDPRERPAEKRQAADERHREFLDERSDFTSLLKLWDFHRDLDEKLSSSRWRKALHDRFLSANRIREWVDLHRQLVSLVRENGWEIGERHSDPTKLHRALLTGLLSGIAQRTDKGDYLGAGGLRFHLWPGSGLATRRPEWIVVNEILETSRRFGRTAAAIDLRWVEPLAGHLVSRSYGEPRWHAKSETAMADERVTLFGLPIVARRPVPLGPRDPEAARRVFLEQGLVDAGFDGGIAPLVKNRETLARISGDAAKLRDAGRLVEAGTILRFYEERIPTSVFDAASLRRALKQTPELASQLTMADEDLLPEPAAAATQAFPDRIRWGSLDVPLDYRFEPGSDDDGVTATIPAAGLDQLSPRQIGWLVPGLIEPRIVAMIRALPKALRRNLVPAPDTARAVAAELVSGEGDFVEAVAKRLSRIAGEPIAPELLLDRLPEHLQVNLRIVDEKGGVLAEGRDLEQLRSEIAPEQIGAITIRSQDWNQEGLKDWTWEELPEQVTVRHGDLTLVAYPGVVDRGESVALQLFDHAATAERASRRGLARLGLILKRKEIRSQVQWLPGKERWPVLGRSIVDPKSLDDDLALLIANLAWLERRPLPRDAATWQARMIGGHEAISVATQDVARVLPGLFQRYHEVRLKLETIEGKLDPRIRDDIRQQLADWFIPHFLIAHPWTWLQHLPRYLHALLQRLEKLPAAGAKDRELLAGVAPHVQRFLDRRTKDERAGRFDPELETYRWWIEELRVSLWAQGLGTSCKVSPQRLEKQWEAVGR